MNGAFSVTLKNDVYDNIVRKLIFIGIEWIRNISDSQAFSNTYFTSNLLYFIGHKMGLSGI